MKVITPGDALHFRGRWQRANKSARVSCPDCGLSASLEGTHEISRFGDVVPSVDCPECDFHDFVSLKGWTEKSVSKRWHGKAVD